MFRFSGLEIMAGTSSLIKCTGLMCMSLINPDDNHQQTENILIYIFVGAWLLFILLKNTLYPDFLIPTEMTMLMGVILFFLGRRFGTVEKVIKKKQED